MWVIEIASAEASIYSAAEDELIDRAHDICATRGHGGWHDWEDEASVRDCYGDDLEDAPEELALLIQEGPVTEIGGNFYARTKHPSQLEWALDTIGDDLHALYTFDDEEGLADFADRYRGHSWVAVQALIEKRLAAAARA